MTSKKGTKTFSLATACVSQTTGAFFFRDLNCLNILSGCFAPSAKRKVLRAANERPIFQELAKTCLSCCFLCKIYKIRNLNINVKM